MRKKRYRHIPWDDWYVEFNMEIYLFFLPLSLIQGMHNHSFTIHFFCISLWKSFSNPFGISLLRPLFASCCDKQWVHVEIESNMLIGNVLKWVNDRGQWYISSEGETNWTYFFRVSSIHFLLNLRMKVWSDDLIFPSSCLVPLLCTSF